MAIILEPAYVLSGLFSLIGLCIAIGLGLQIISKYFKYKKRVFLLVGLTAILISEPWWPSAIGFLVILTTGQNLTTETYLILGVVLIPLLVLVWLTAFTDLLFNKYQKIILGIYGIYGIIFEIVFFSLLFINPLLIGTLSGYFDPSYGSFVRIYQYSLMGTLGITFILFALESLKSDNPELKLKGKLLIMAIFTFILGGTLDIIGLINFPDPTSVMIVVIARIIMILTSIEFYGAMILPEWMKKLFLKRDIE